MDVKTNQQLAFCVGCANGKHCKNPFKKGDPKKIFTILLKLVHIDLCGSMKMTLMKGAWFLMIFTNENTKVVWTHFLKSKSKSLATFKEFQAMVETNSRKKRLQATNPTNGTQDDEDQQNNNFFQSKFVIENPLLKRWN